MSTDLSVREKKRKINFQDGYHGGQLGFPIGTILSIFDLQVTPMLATKFQVSGTFKSGEEAKNKFSRWLPCWPSWIFAIFDVQVHPMLPTKFQVHWPLGSGEEAKNRFPRWRPWRPSWISDQNNFIYF